MYSSVQICTAVIKQGPSRDKTGKNSVLRWTDRQAERRTQVHLLNCAFAAKKKAVLLCCLLSFFSAFHKIIFYYFCFLNSRNSSVALRMLMNLRSSTHLLMNQSQPIVLVIPEDIWGRNRLYKEITFENLFIQGGN